MPALKTLMINFLKKEGEQHRFTVTNDPDGIATSMDGNLGVLAFFLCREMINNAYTKAHILDAWSDAENYIKKYEPTRTL